jgi:hypothetical protein
VHTPKRQLLDKLYQLHLIATAMERPSLLTIAPDHHAIGSFHPGRRVGTQADGDEQQRYLSMEPYDDIIRLAVAGTRGSHARCDGYRRLNHKWTAWQCWFLTISSFHPLTDDERKRRRDDEQDLLKSHATDTRALSVLRLLLLHHAARHNVTITTRDAATIIAVTKTSPGNPTTVYSDGNILF